MVIFYPFKAGGSWDWNRSENAARTTSFNGINLEVINEVPV